MIVMERVSEFEITLHEERRQKGEKPFYAFHSEEEEYLHNDGTLYKWTDKGGLNFSGYFSTIEEVKQAIELYNQLNAK